MSKFYKNVFSVIACILSFLSLAKAADTKVYSWRDENGNVVFSEEKPSDEVDYKIIEVGQPTVIDTKTQQNPTNDKPVKINQSDVAKLATSELAEKTKKFLKKAKMLISTLRLPHLLIMLTFLLKKVKLLYQPILI